MIRRFLIGLAMVLAVASASRGQDREAAGRERQKQDEAHRLYQLRVDEAAELMRQKAAVAEIRAQQAKAAAAEARQIARTVTLRGNTRLKGELIRLSRPVTLVIPEPVVEDQGDLDSETEVVEPPPVPVRRNILDYVVAEENFDIWVFGPNLGPDERRSRLFDLFEVQLGRTNDRYHLTDAEVVKLRLAGAGDIKRFLDDVEASRRNFNAVRKDLVRGAKALEGLQPLMGHFQTGPSDDFESLYAKTLAKIRADRSAASTDVKPKD